MKLRKTDQRRIVYLDSEGGEHPREELLEAVQGKSISEGKAIVRQYERLEVVGWANRAGEIVAWSYSPLVASIEIKPADAEVRRADLLRRLREAQAKLARPDPTPQDLSEALRLQIDYLELMDQLAD